MAFGKGTGAVRVQIEVLGETQVNRRMLRWVERASDARPVWAAIVEYLMRIEARQFDTEGGSSGHPWAPLKEATKKAKARHGLRPEILRATDALRDALTVPGDSNQKVLMKKDMMIFGVKGKPGEYGPILMKKEAHDGRPRRPVDLTALNRRTAVKMIQLWIARGVVALVPEA